MNLQPKQNIFIPFGPIRSVERVTAHALVRFTARTLDPPKTVGKALARLEKILAGAVPVDLKRKSQIRKLHTHRYKSVIYYAHLNGKRRPKRGIEVPKESLILVVGNCGKDHIPTILTVHKNDSREWVMG